MKKILIKKNIYFKIIWVLLILLIFSIIIIQQSFDHITKKVIGKNTWYFLYIILPMIIILLSLVNKYLFKTKMKQRVIIYSLIALCIYIFIAILVPVSSYKYIKIFTPEKWLNYKYERKLMIEDLNAKYNLKNMTKNKKKNILGAPDVETEKEIEYVIAEGWIDPEIMVLAFDNQKVIEGYTYIEFKTNKIVNLFEN